MSGCTPATGIITGMLCAAACRSAGDRVRLELEGLGAVELAARRVDSSA